MELLQVILTSLSSVVVLFILAKIMGHKQVSQLDFFDYITGITIGSIAAELATELEEPLKPLIAMIVYGIIAVGLNFITSKLPRSRKYINGSPTILMDKGCLYRKNLKKAKLDLSEFLMMCRQAGYFNVNDIQTAVFECNGKLSVLPMSNKRPATPEDMNMNPPQENISTEVIMEGRILEDNLNRLGLNKEWLLQQVNSQGFESEKDIFLGICDDNHTLALYKNI